MYHLIIKSPFGDYGYGAKITNAKAVEAALAEHPEKVLKITVGEQVKGAAKK